MATKRSKNEVASINDDLSELRQRSKRYRPLLTNLSTTSKQFKRDIAKEELEISDDSGELSDLNAPSLNVFQPPLSRKGSDCPTENRKSPPLLADESTPVPPSNYATGNLCGKVTFGGRWACEDEEETPSPPSFTRTVAQIVFSVGFSSSSPAEQSRVSKGSHTPILFRPNQIDPVNEAICSPPELTLAPDSNNGAKVTDDLLERAKEAAASLQIPPSLMAGKIINTEYGLALLLVPNSSVNATEYAKLSMPSGVDTTKCKHWTKAEDALLEFAVSKESGPPYNWTEIGRTYFPDTRRSSQCKNRWKKLHPSSSNEPFTAEEDKVIVAGQADGLSWAAITAQLPGRATESVRNRFANSLDPSLLKNVAWSAEEEEILRIQQQKLGNKWKQIAIMLPGRSDNDVKNHWHNAKLKTNRIIKSLAADHNRATTLANLRNGYATKKVKKQTPPSDSLEDPKQEGPGERVVTHL